MSEAVESSYNNTKQLLNVHVVQGDIYNPPFREGTFDFIYSIGVLHHLPDPQGGFTSLTRFLKPNATMFAWVYGPRYGISQKISVLLRQFTGEKEGREGWGGHILTCDGEGRIEIKEYWDVRFGMGGWKDGRMEECEERKGRKGGKEGRKGEESRNLWRTDG